MCICMYIYIYILLYSSLGCTIAIGMVPEGFSYIYTYIHACTEREKNGTEQVPHARRKKKKEREREREGDIYIYIYLFPPTMGVKRIFLRPQSPALCNKAGGVPLHVSDSLGPAPNGRKEGRERERYICIYTNIHTYIHIYIYVNIEQACLQPRKGPLRLPARTVKGRPPGQGT